MPAERLEAGEGALGHSAATAAHHQVGEHVGDADQDDQVTKGHDLVGHREGNGVAQEREARIGVGEFARTAQHHSVEVLGVDHAGLDERVGSHRCGAVESDRHEVGDHADAHDGHADEAQVPKGEGESGHEAGHGDQAGLGEIELVDGDAAHDGGSEERNRCDADASEGGQATSPGETDERTDDDGQNHGRESHGGILLVMPADRRPP